MRDRNNRSHRPAGLAKGWAGTYDHDRRHDDTDLRDAGRMAAAQTVIASTPAPTPGSLEAMDAEQERAMRRAAAEHRPLDARTLARRRKYIDRLMADELKNDTKQRYTFTYPDGSTAYTPERQRLHDRIMREKLADEHNIPREGKILFSGGLAGAGKSSVLHDGAFQRELGEDTSYWLRIDNDEIKEMLAKEGAIPRHGCLTPMETSALVYRESADIVKTLLQYASERHMNVILDGTMGNREATAARIRTLRDAGYSVRALFVDISPDTSKRRAESRYRQGMDEYVRDGRGQGGRYLPPSVIDSQRTPDGSTYRSRNAETLIRLDREGLFDRPPVVYDNDVDGRAPQPVDYREFAGRAASAR